MANDPLSFLDEPIESSKKQDPLSFLDRPNKRSIPKAARVGMQLGLGATEAAVLPYEIGVAPLASKDAQHAEYRKNIFEDIERLQEQKAAGVWDRQDQQLYDSLVEQIKNPEMAEKFVKTADVGTRKLFEKATGIDTHPVGTLEKAANWVGFLKRPQNAAKLLKGGVTPGQVIKEILPGKTALRGLTAGSALQMAEEEEFGPLGTIAAAVVGDLAGAGLPGVGKAIVRPKESIAKALATFGSKNAIVKDLEQATKGKGFTRDLGTITNNRVIKTIQARLVASGLVGKPLQDLRKQMVNEIVDSYENIGNELGTARFENLTEAGEVGKEALASIRDTEKSRIGTLYEESRNALTDEAAVNPIKLASSIKNLKAKLAPGAVKSTEQKAVLNVLENLEKDLYDANGKLKPTSVKALINNKAALHDIINYEVQGGQKQLLKSLTNELDKMIVSHGVANPQFLKKYAQANKDFAKHAKDFRNEVIDKILMSRDPMILMNKMNTVQGIRDIRNALGYTSEGRRIFGELSRKKMDLMFGDNLNTGLREQLKLGTFSNVLRKGKNRELMRELLPKESFKKLENLQVHAGELANTANEFLNSSQTATATTDMTILAALLSSFFGAITGNPFAYKFLGGFAAARLFSKFIADPKFLSLVEEAIAAGRSKNISLMEQVAQKMKPYLEEISQAAPVASRSQSD